MHGTYGMSFFFNLHAHQAKEKNGQHLTKIHHINQISGKKTVVAHNIKY